MLSPCLGRAGVSREKGCQGAAPRNMAPSPLLLSSATAPCPHGSWAQQATRLQGILVSGGESSVACEDTQAVWGGELLCWAPSTSPCSLGCDALQRSTVQQERKKAVCSATPLHGCVCSVSLGRKHCPPAAYRTWPGRELTQGRCAQGGMCQAGAELAGAASRDMCGVVEVR